MANEKVDVVIVGAGASGSVFASVLAKAGKKVVILEAGPDWQLTDLISSEMWGRRIRPAGAPFLLEGKNPFGYAGQAGWGVGGAALHYFANHPRYLPNDFKIKSEHNRAHRLADLLPGRRPVLRQGRARHRHVGRCQGGGEVAPAGPTLSDAADEDLPPRRNLGEGLRVARHPHGAGAGRDELDRIQGATGLHLRRLVPCRLPDRCARQSDGHVSERGQKGQSRGACALHRHARAHQPAGHPRHRRRVLRREEAAAGAGGERRRAGRVVGAEPAHHAQLGDRQASEGAEPTRTVSSANT